MHEPPKFAKGQRLSSANMTNAKTSETARNGFNFTDRRGDRDESTKGSRSSSAKRAGDLGRSRDDGTKKPTAFGASKPKSYVAARSQSGKLPPLSVASAARPPTGPRRIAGDASLASKVAVAQSRNRSVGPNSSASSTTGAGRSVLSGNERAEISSLSRTREPSASRLSNLQRETVASANRRDAAMQIRQRVEMKRAVSAAGSSASATAKPTGPGVKPNVARNKSGTRNINISDNRKSQPNSSRTVAQAAWAPQSPQSEIPRTKSSNVTRVQATKVSSHAQSDVTRLSATEKATALKRSQPFIKKDTLASLNQQRKQLTKIESILKEDAKLSAYVTSNSLAAQPNATNDGQQRQQKLLNLSDISKSQLDTGSDGSDFSDESGGATAEHRTGQKLVDVKQTPQTLVENDNLAVDSEGRSGKNEEDNVSNDNDSGVGTTPNPQILIKHKLNELASDAVLGSSSDGSNSPSTHVEEPSAQDMATVLDAQSRDPKGEIHRTERNDTCLIFRRVEEKYDDDDEMSVSPSGSTLIDVIIESNEKLEHRRNNEVMPAKPDWNELPESIDEIDEKQVATSITTKYLCEVKEPIYQSEVPLVIKEEPITSDESTQETNKRLIVSEDVEEKLVQPLVALEGTVSPDVDDRRSINVADENYSSHRDHPDGRSDSASKNLETANLPCVISSSETELDAAKDIYPNLKAFEECMNKFTITSAPDGPIVGGSQFIQIAEERREGELAETADVGIKEERGDEHKSDSQAPEYDVDGASTENRDKTNEIQSEVNSHLEDIMRRMSDLCTDVLVYEDTCGDRPPEIDSEIVCDKRTVDDLSRAPEEETRLENYHLMEDEHSCLAPEASAGDNTNVAALEPQRESEHSSRYASNEDLSTVHDESISETVCEPYCELETTIELGDFEVTKANEKASNVYDADDFAETGGIKVNFQGFTDADDACVHESSKDVVFLEDGAESPDIIGSMDEMGSDDLKDSREAASSCPQCSEQRLDFDRIPDNWEKISQEDISRLPEPTEDMLHSGETDSRDWPSKFAAEESCIAATGEEGCGDCQSERAISETTAQKSQLHNILEEILDNLDSHVDRVVDNTKKHGAEHACATAVTDCSFVNDLPGYNISSILKSSTALLHTRMIQSIGPFSEKKVFGRADPWDESTYDKRGEATSSKTDSNDFPDSKDFNEQPM